MALNCGIVGLPNVGKSTLFSAITAAPAEAANYPFCTIDPNVGIVEVPDKRLDQITEYIVPQKIIPTVIEFVDIAGLVKGASKGEGLGNKFLANIREVNAIVHVVRCFENDNIVHVEGSIDPLRDIATIEMELAFADLESVQKRREKNIKATRSADKKVAEEAKILEGLLSRLEKHLDEGKPARSIEMSEPEKEASKGIQLITSKKVLYCCNVDEDSAADGNKYVDLVRKHAAENDSEMIFISAQVESEISSLETKEERSEFLSDLGLKESGLDKLVKAAYKLLNLNTYFTAGEKEVRAWTFKNGFTAPQCAGVIHTDFERGFIKAEIYHCEDLFTHKNEAAIKDAGKVRMEGKEYIMKDGDVCHFRFNV
ncbi:redox-regulated ATPase YchF [Candidatus Kapabacteria bacterium]|nr:redox-regulated ATPase YchF [Candidatus Kapabacteria bacterium]